MASMTYHVDLKGKKYLVTQQFQLADMDRWDDDIRDWIADQLDITLNEEHIAAINFIRTTYQRRKQHPMVRVVAKALGDQFGEEKGSLRYFYSLFPKGVHQAVMIAGLPVRGMCF